jgi:hypothetical protein
MRARVRERAAWRRHPGHREAHRPCVENGEVAIVTVAVPQNDDRLADWARR